MSKNVVSFDDRRLPTKLANRLGGSDINDDLSAGVTGGFSVLSFRGSKWRIKAGGEETPITDSDDEPVSSLRCLILKGNKHISKNYYDAAYEEGSIDKPRCFSVDGIKPDAGVEDPISKTCAACPNNVFGSRITPSGKKAKACSDSRRLAVLPEGDLSNEQFGGPMLLRVPAASLTELATYAKRMKAKGFPYNTVITRIGFDMDAAYPKLTFKAVRPLTEEEESEVLGLLDDEEFGAKVEAVLAAAVENIAHGEPVADDEEEEDDPTEFEEPVAAPKKKAAAKKAAPAKKKAAPKPQDDEEDEPSPKAGKKAAAEDAEDDLDEELDDILASLDNLD